MCAGAGKLVAAAELNRLVLLMRQVSAPALLTALTLKRKPAALGDGLGTMHHENGADTVVLWLAPRTWQTNATFAHMFLFGAFTYYCPMKHSDRRAFVILFAFAAIVCALVYATSAWMTDSGGDVDTKSSVTAPPA